jgi:hypothetical protein
VVAVAQQVGQVRSLLGKRVGDAVMSACTAREVGVSAVKLAAD